MKGFKRLFCLLLCALTCVSASPLGMGVFAAECAHTYENVVENGKFSYYGCSKCGTVVDTLPVIFFSNVGGNNDNDGFTDKTPVKTMKTAFIKLAGYGVGGTAVLCGQSYISGSDYELQDAGATVTVTSVYNGVDYRDTKTACLITVNPLYINSDLVFDCVNLVETSNAKNWYLQYNDVAINDTCEFYTNAGGYKDTNPPVPVDLSQKFAINIITGYASDGSVPAALDAKDVQTVVVNCNGFNVLAGNKTGSTAANSFGHKTGPDSSATGLPNVRVNIFIGEGILVGSMDLSPVNNLTPKVFFTDGRTDISYQQYTGGAYVTSSSIADYSKEICYLLMDMESAGLPAPEETVHVIDADKFTAGTVEKRANPVPYPALRVPFVTEAAWIESATAPVAEFGVLMSTAANGKYIAYQTAVGKEGGAVGKSVCYDADSNDYVYAGGDTPVTFYGVLEFDKGGYEGKTFTAVPYAVVNSSSVGGKYTLIGASVDFKYNENATDEPGTDVPDIEDPDDGEQNDKTFDEENIVLSFGAISDVHIEMGEAANKANFTKALNTLLDFAEADDGDGLDAVVVAGDMISNNSKNEEHAHKEINRFSIIVKEFANSSFGTNVLVTVGNHDSRSELSKLPSLYNTYLGAEYFAMDVENDLAKGYRHAVINGYHFILAEPLTSPYGEFDEDVLEWIDETLAKITAENPDQYVFFVTHPTVANTVYGSEDDFEPGHNRWRSTNLGPVLQKYPQVITFSGHTHSPIFDERCIMQTEFTAVNTGSTANTAFELDKYENMVENTLPVMDNSEVSTGLMVQADANGNVKITRIMFSQNAEIKEAWYLEAPNTDGSHLEKYTRDGREAANEAPVLAGTVTANAGTDSVKITFPAGTDDDFVHHYVFTVKDASGKQVKEIFALTDFFCVTDASEMLKTFTYEIALEKGSYTVDIKAVDCWNAESGVISADFTVKADPSAPDALDSLTPYDGAKLKIACIGDSITQGTGVSDQVNDSYPGQLQEILGENYVVGNFGKASSYVLKADSEFNTAYTDKPQLSYTNTTQYADSIAFNPDVVVIMLGTNDMRHMISDAAKAEFVATLKELAETYKALESVKKVYLCSNIHVYSSLMAYQLSSGEMSRLVKEAAEAAGCEYLDVNGITYDYMNVYMHYTGDRLHPAEEGYTEMAKVICAGIRGKDVEVTKPAVSDTGVVYVSDTGVANGKGATPETAIDDLAKAAGLLRESGGTIVVCGPLTVDHNTFMPNTDKPITVTSVYNGVDYRTTASAKLNMGYNLYLGGDMTFDKLDLHVTSTGLIFVCNFHNIVIGEDFNSTAASSSVKFPVFVIGKNAGNEGVPAEYMDFDGECNIVINGGEWNYIRGGNRRQSTGYPIGSVLEGASVTVTINGGTFHNGGSTAHTSATGMNSVYGTCTLVINGGTINGDICGVGRVGTRKSGMTTEMAGTVNLEINGGTVTGVIKAVQDTTSNVTSAGKINVTCASAYQSKLEGDFSSTVIK